MNSYFANPFASPLAGDGQGPGGGLPCNFGGLAGRYDQGVGQAYACGAGGGVHAYNSLGAGQQLNAIGSSEHNGCPRPTDLSGYETHQAQINSPPHAVWTAPGGGGSHPTTDFSHHQLSCVSDIGSASSPNATTPHPTYTHQPIPFYPWMGVVGGSFVSFPRRHCLIYGHRRRPRRRRRCLLGLYLYDIRNLPSHSMSTPPPLRSL